MEGNLPFHHALLIGSNNFATPMLLKLIFTAIEATVYITAFNCLLTMIRLLKSSITNHYVFTGTPLHNTTIFVANCAPKPISSTYPKWMGL